MQDIVLDLDYSLRIDKCGTKRGFRITVADQRPSTVYLRIIEGESCYRCEMLYNDNVYTLLNKVKYIKSQYELLGVLCKSIKHILQKMNKIDYVEIVSPYPSYSKLNKRSVFVCGVANNTIVDNNIVEVSLTPTYVDDLRETLKLAIKAGDGAMYVRKVYDRK